MTVDMETLDAVRQFLADARDTREYKRGLVIKLLLEDHFVEDICALLDITPAFVSKWRIRFKDTGLDGLKLGYRGSSSYLTAEERQEILDWLHQQNVWDIVLLSDHVALHYGVVFKSKQSYYQLFADANIHWKKVQPINPKKDEAAVIEKKKRL